MPFKPVAIKNPQNLPFPLGIQCGPLSIHPSLDRPHSPLQTASKSNQPCCHNTLSARTDWLKDGIDDRWVRRMLTLYYINRERHVDMLIITCDKVSYLFCAAGLCCRAQENFRVYVLLPLLPAFEGEIGTSTGTAIQAVVHWNYSSICRGGNSLLERLILAGGELYPSKNCTVQ